jgi:hypothetical protein
VASEALHTGGAIMEIEFSIAYSSNECFPLILSKEESWATTILGATDPDVVTNRCNFDAIVRYAIGTFLPHLGLRQRALLAIDLGEAVLYRRDPHRARDRCDGPCISTTR